MHLTKNFCVNLIAYLGVYGKTKDTIEARQELQRMEERDALHPQQQDNVFVIELVQKEASPVPTELSRSLPFVLTLLMTLNRLESLNHDMRGD